MITLEVRKNIIRFVRNNKFTFYPPLEKTKNTFHTLKDCPINRFSQIHKHIL